MNNGKPMKVRDLIHALQQFDPDSEAVTYNEALKTYDSEDGTRYTEYHDD